MLFCCQHLTLNKVAIWYLIFTKPDGLLYVRDHFKLLKLLFLFLSLTLADSLLDKSDFMSQQIDPGRYPRTFQPIIDLSRRDLFFFVILSLTSWAPPRESYVRGDGAVLGASQRYLLAGGFEPATLCIQVSSLNRLLLTQVGTGGAHWALRFFRESNQKTLLWLHLALNEKKTET